MKNTYSLLLALATTFTFAQQSISFEASEDYQPGSLHQQNGWEVTEGSDGILLNQVVSTEKASQGSMSFKNAYEPNFGSQFVPIFGAAKVFETPVDHNNFTISYDVLVTEKLGADFEFTLFAIDENDEYVPVAGVGIENRGFIYLIKDVNYGFNYAQSEWTPNTWVNVKIEVTANEIKYYINNALQSTIANFTQLDIVGLNMLHNNYGNDAYYDNFVISTESLSNDRFEKDLVSVYPNPSNGFISISTSNEMVINDIAIYTITGQKVLQASQPENIDISRLSIGTYFIKAATDEGIQLTTKIIKQ